MKEYLLNVDQLAEIRANFRKENKKVVFTNGCFDILHAGHVEYLNKAKAMGDILIIAINSDDSVKKIKGDLRPIVPENQRAFLLSNLRAVDYVVKFDEDTPYEVIKKLVPDVLVKGGDWAIENIVGKEIVEENGGSVKNIEFETDQSTSKIIEKIIRAYK